MFTPAQELERRRSRNDQAQARASMERFERWRAALGFRPGSIYVETEALMPLREFIADQLLMLAANDD